MKTCRICGHALDKPLFEADAPAITSLSTRLEVPTAVYACVACGHAQSPDLPDLATFYDTEYRISLASDDHDQLVRMEGGRPVYRTEVQARVVLDRLDPQPGASILDYGAAKATTLRQVIAMRPGLDPYVFDVSADYRSYWSSWLPDDKCATYDLPGSWKGRFEFITAHFVLEHVPDPVGTLTRLREFLRPEGKIMVTVPDVVANPGDFIVVDHLNHFTRPSLGEAFRRAGFDIVGVEDNSYLPGALVSVAKVSDVSSDPSSKDEGGTAETLDQLAHFWRGAASSLTRAADRWSTRPAAIFGAGFYGTWIALTLGDRIDLRCFLDNNPHERSRPRLGLPVHAPDDMPDEIEVLYVGLNPRRARAIVESVEQLKARNLTIVWLDGASEPSASFGSGLDHP